MDKAHPTITLSSGQTIPVWTLNGIVADNQHSSSTRVYSSGGGGYVGPNGGYIDAAEIHSEVTTRQSVWITDDRSKDTEVWFRNRQIPVRVGHRVTAKFVMPQGSGEWRLETSVNHDSQQVHSWLAENPGPDRFDGVRPRVASCDGVRRPGCCGLLVCGDEAVRDDQLAIIFSDALGRLAAAQRSCNP